MGVKRESGPDTATNGFLRRALELLERSPLIDGHNDLAIALREKVGGIGVSSVDLRGPVEGLDTDIPRLRAGRVGGQFWSVWVPADLPEERVLPMALEQLDIADGLAARYPDVLGRAQTADEVEAVFESGRIASLLGLEGGSMIASSLPILRTFFARGVRYMTLTHWKTTRWADAATDDPRHGGLTAFGREVVREMNRLGMLVDLSHVAPTTMAAALEVTESPVVFSHSGAYAMNPHVRNVPDEILRRIPANGGVVMAVFLAQFVSDEVRRHVEPAETLEEAFEREHPDAPPSAVREVRRAWLAANPPPKATLQQLADHIDHLVELMGPQNVGIGSDFDGGELLPVGMEDVSRFPYLVAELLRRGYAEDDVRAIAGGNILRVMRSAEAAARRIQAERPPSEATIEALDGSTTQRMGTPSRRMDDRGNPSMEPNALRSWFDHRVETHEFSGVALVWTNGAPLFQYAGGIAHRGHQVPITSETRFGVASVTKMVTATTALRLVDRGELRLDQPLIEVLPAEHRTRAMAPGHTLHHLLSHTSGLPNYHDDAAKTWDSFVGALNRIPGSKALRPADMLPLFADLPAERAPGEKYLYADANFILAGLVIEAATGSSFYEVATEEVLQPAGMADTAFEELDQDPRRYANGYLHAEGPPDTWRSNIFSLTGKGMPDGGMITSAQDLARLIDALLGGRLLSPPLLTAMMTPQAPPSADIEHYGYGLELVVENGAVTILGHGGSDPGVSTMVAHHLAAATTIVVLCNQDRGSWAATSRLAKEFGLTDPRDVKEASS